VVWEERSSSVFKTMKYFATPEIGGAKELRAAGDPRA
jgi:hypothetical protein